jgi:hypothetical protein
MQVVSELEVESRDLLPLLPVDSLIEQNMQLVGKVGAVWIKTLGTPVIGWSRHVKTRNRHVKCWSIPICGSENDGFNMINLQRYGMIAYSQPLDADTIGSPWYCGVKKMLCALDSSGLIGRFSVTQGASKWLVAEHGGGWVWRVFSIISNRWRESPPERMVKHGKTW